MAAREAGVRMLGAAVAAAVMLAAPWNAEAQQLRRELLQTPDGVALELPARAGWRVRARSVAERRALLRSQGRGALLAAPGAEPSTALTGAFRLPAILLGYRDLIGVPAARLDSVYFGLTAPEGRPYTLRTFYSEMSNGTFDLDGDVYGWYRADSARAYYLEACGTYVNAMFCATGRMRLGRLLRRVLLAADSVVDFGAFDNDGPDGVPNSGDDDGVVDAVHFVHPDLGGECGGPGYWAHTFGLAGLDTVFVTDDRRPDGGAIVVDGYFLTAGGGGEDCDAAWEVTTIGVSAHEFAHVLGLPDLYDTDPDDGDRSEGIGEWGLMGSGNFTTLVSPAHLSAWSKERLGWVAVRELSEVGPVTLGPVVTGDTVLLIRPGGANPRGEYFLLENKQPVGSDAGNLTVGGVTGPKVGGLLIWHVDSARIAEAEPSNLINSGPIHGVRLIQADAWGALERGWDRGDAGDPFPGTSGKTALRLTSQPGIQLNAPGTFPGFRIDSIAEVVPQVMGMHFAAGNPTVVWAVDSVANVRVDGESVRVFREVLLDGAVHTVEMDSVQASGIGRYLFHSWSDGGARRHDITTRLAGDTVVATVDVQYRLQTNTIGRGDIQTAGGVVRTSTATFHEPSSVVTLIAVPEPGSVLSRWDGVPPTDRDTIAVTMDGPHDVTAWFVPTLALATDSLTPGRVGYPYSDSLVATGGLGPYRWLLVSDGPRGLRVDSNGVVSGIPEQTWDGTITLNLHSDTYSVFVTSWITIAAPAVALDDVLDQLLETGTPLDEEQLYYLDFIGNRNGRLDPGDVYRWLAVTGQLAPPPGVQAVREARP